MHKVGKNNYFGNRVLLWIICILTMLDVFESWKLLKHITTVYENIVTK